MLKRTPFYERHLEAGARFTEFGGWEMPVSYSGILEETIAVRTRAGLFDLSHMGELVIKGGGAGEFLNRVITRDVLRLRTGGVLYALICREDGGIVDDVLVYRLDDGYMMVVNAANTEKDLEWLRASLPGSGDVEIQDRSEETALLAIQGPESAEILARLSEDDFSSLRYYTFRQGRISGVEAIVSRTGYTGEDGFEIYFDAAQGLHLWAEFLEAGEGGLLIPVGLGARDVLRLEMRYPLYGNDITEETTPLEAGLGWAVDWEKGCFRGRDSLFRQREEGIRRRLTGFVMDERGVPRHGAPIFYEGRERGQVTSGTYSPSLKKEIGLGYLPVEASAPGTRIGISIRGGIRTAHVVKTPFLPPHLRRITPKKKGDEGDV